VFLALATERDPVTGDLTHVQRIYGQAVAHAHLRSVEGRFDWDWRARENGLNLEYLLWPIAFSAVELLTGGERNRVKVCANPDGCGWLFYDGSKNGSRRWCSMEGCGSQVKMRRQYAKRVGRVMRDA
jgi:predicted RNA-binding Zn ribbon-like protein